MLVIWIKRNWWLLGIRIYSRKCQFNNKTCNIIRNYIFWHGWRLC